MSLQQAETAISTSPRDAMAMLDSINPDELSESRRHYYDLLTIMARDKAYITHTSDSLILDVVDYYSSRKSDPLYPKALYFGGRVYSDLGDYPTALDYFQQALEKMPEGDEHLYFKGVVLSQTGRLLNSLRMFSQAIPYIEQSIEIDKHLSDTFGLAYDNKLLGAIYYHKHDFEKAESYLIEGMRYASALSPTDSANFVVYLADIQFLRNNIDSALTLVRFLPDKVSPSSRNRILSSASKIYLGAGIVDTAYMYATELIHSEDFQNRKSGYHTLFSPELYDIIPKDSLRRYFYTYKIELEKFLDKHDSQEVLIQNSLFNYSKFVRERDEAEASRVKTERILFSVIFIALIILTILFYVKYRDSKEILRLRKTLDLFENLNTDGEKSATVEPPVYDADSLRGRLFAKFENLDKSDESEYSVPEAILRSDAYNLILKNLDNGDGTVCSEIWDALAAVIEESIPGFQKRLNELTDGKISEANYRMVLLIKCGFSPTAISTILIKAKGTISSNRRYLGKKIFGETVSGQLFDRVIRPL